MTSSASPTLFSAQMGAYADAPWHDYYETFVHLIPKGSAVLDVGSGPGALAAWLTTHRGCRVTCVDGSPVAVDACRSRGLTAIAADLNGAWSVDGIYDVVLFSSSLESLLDPCRVLRDARGNLGPLAKTLVWAPNFGYAGARLAYLRGRCVKSMGSSPAARTLAVWNYDDIQFFTRPSLDTALLEAGYERRTWHDGSAAGDLQYRSLRGLARAAAFAGIGALCGFRQPGLYSPHLCVEAWPS